MTSDSTRFRLADDVTHQSLGQGRETVILSLRSGHFFTCNETTAAFLQAVDGRRTFAEIVDRLGERFEVPRDRLRGDLERLAEELTSEGLIFPAEHCDDSPS